jgi:hypothetical protein
VISSDLIHNHPEEENIEKQALSNGVKRKAIDNLIPTQTCKTIASRIATKWFFGSDFHL